jgi:hypothetical protein
MWLLECKVVLGWGPGWHGSVQLSPACHRQHRAEGTGTEILAHCIGSSENLTELFYMLLTSHAWVVWLPLSSSDHWPSLEENVTCYVSVLWAKLLAGPISL